jgi:hypothetical protein
VMWCEDTICLQRVWTLRLQRPHECDCYLWHFKE